MKNNIIYQLVIAIGIAFVFYACEEIVNEPLVIGEKPGKITDYTVQSLPGAAKIEFSLPESKDLLYVKAEYEIADGVKREAISSKYKNNLIVDGFPAEGEYDVILYSVAQGNVMSDPTSVKIKTLTPPYLTAFNSLSMQAVFGGINVAFMNESEGDLVFHVLIVDSTNAWQPAETYYTSLKEGDFSVRGFDTLSYQFGTYVRDRWGNISDTLIGTFKPLYETLIDKSTFAPLNNWPGDVWWAHTGAPSLVMAKIWDDKTTGSSDCFHTTPNTGMPQSFSFDMGKKVKLSRFKYYQRSSTRWNAGNPRFFELWGSNDPNPDGTWDSWTKIGGFESVKPSGEPLGTNTAEDIALAVAGEDFDVPIITPAYRYYRWNTLQTWANMTYISIGELTFWGSIINE